MAHTNPQYSILCTNILIGNSSNEPEEKNQKGDVDSSVSKFEEGSKTIYINDSYNLDTIPFDVDEIIDTDNVEDTV